MSNPNSIVIGLARKANRQRKAPDSCTSNALVYSIDRAGVVTVFASAPHFAAEVGLVAGEFVALMARAASLGGVACRP